MDIPQFSQKAQEELKYYVYCLVDPRDRKIFYIGKGVGNRVFAHAYAALESENLITDKLDKIREIISSGYKVHHYIIRHKLTEEDALTVESVLIDFLTYQDFNTESLLTNIVAGHHQWDEGIKTVEEINQLYDCQPLKLKEGHQLLMVNLNRTYHVRTVDGMKVRPDLYDATRQSWHINKANADQIDYLLGVYKGVVRCVIKPTTEWLLVKRDENGKRMKTKRYYIEGVTDDKEGNDLYLNKDTSAYPFGSGSPIRYVKE
ncbi:MAG: endonuclease [Bacteroidales bacterium]|nr:endonuclease [Bacteroidales bacterium]